MEGSRPPPGQVGSVSAALKILDLLAASPKSLRLKDIAGSLSLNASTCLNILRTLAAAGVVHVDRTTKTYGPGLALATLARAALARDARLAVARPLIEEIASKHAVAAMLWRKAGPEEMVLLLIASGNDAWRVQLGVGSRSPLLHGSMGRVMAAHGDIPKDDLRRQFQKLSWDRAPSYTEFVAQSEAARDRGWAIDAGYFNRSLLSISVPVIELAGGCESVLTTAMFSGQHDDAGRAKIGEELMKAAHAISREPFGPS